jgi:hypothetical protein
MSIKLCSIFLCATIVAGCALQVPEAPASTPLPDPSMDLYDEFEQCKAAAMQMDASARRRQSVAQYRTAAVLFERCVTVYSRSAIAAEEMMYLQAMSVLDYVRAGAIDAAVLQLQVFRNAFPHHDLYLADGSSFLDTMQLLLTDATESHLPDRLLNATSKSIADAQRRRYWATH